MTELPDQSNANVAATRESELARLLEKLPFFDGSGRRRIVSGGILAVTSLIVAWDVVKDAVFDVTLDHLISSPLLVAALFLLIYAAGSAIELLGEFFVVRAASNVFWAFDLPLRKSRVSSNRFQKWRSRIWWLLAVIPAIPFGLIVGFLGRTYYHIEMPERLNDDALRKLQLPETVINGLKSPVGNEAELALKHVCDLLSGEDYKWARKLLSKSRDVQSTTTALILVVAFLSFSGITSPPSTMPADLAQLANSTGVAAERVSDALLRKFGDDEVAEKFGNEINTMDEIAPNLDTLTTYEPEARVRVLELKKAFETVRDALQVDDARKEVSTALRFVGNFDRGAESWHDDLQWQARVSTVLTWISPIALLLLYVGFFTGLRNAIVAILDAANYSTQRRTREI